MINSTNNEMNVPTVGTDSNKNLSPTYPKLKNDLPVDTLHSLQELWNALFYIVIKLLDLSM